MQGKGIIRFFAIALGIVTLFQLSFTLKTNMVENNAEAYGELKAEQVSSQFAEMKEENPIAYYDTLNSIRNFYEQRYLDSISNTTVYDLLITDYTYNQIKDNELSLGLDLQGGMSVIMQVSVKDLLVNLAGTNAKDPDFRKAINLASQRERSSDEDFVDLFLEAYQEVTNGGRLAAIFATRQNQGLIEPDYDNERIAQILRREANDAVDRTFEILSTRIDQFGVSSPVISKVENSDRIFVELPGVGNPTRVRHLLQAAAELEFWETFKVEQIASDLIAADAVVRELEGFAAADSAAQEDTIKQTTPVVSNVESDSVMDASDTALSVTGDSAGFMDIAMEDDTSMLGQDGVDPLKQNPLLARINFSEGNFGTPYVGFVLPKDTSIVGRYLRNPEVQAALRPELKILWGAKPNEEGYIPLYAIKKNPLDENAALEGDVISDARQDFDEFGQPAVTMVMNSEGAAEWARLTAANVGNEIAIVLDDKVYSAPTVNQEIRGGNSEITGNFTIAEAKDLANKLKSGKLPAPARIVQESIVGPTLGAESIQAGILSLISGLILVVLFMVFYYTGAGIIANIALVLNIFYIFGLLASLGATLTLPGFAGIVLTIGMAVDANVIIFERIREEVRRGKGLRLAIVDGFQHSYSAIIDANVTTLITAFILFYFGLGPVKGFATVLIIGILSSLFTAVLISRVIFEWWIKKDRNVSFGNKMTLNALSNINIDWIGKRKIAYVISGIVILAGIIGFVTRGFELGVDFKGGRSYHIRFEKPVEAKEIRQELTAVFGATPIVKTVGAANELKITTAYMIDSTGRKVDSIVGTTLMKGLAPHLSNFESLNLKKFTDKYVLESLTVQPTIADDIKNRAMVATIVSLIGIFLYILVRFKKWQFSVGALAALAHDVMIVLGVYALLHGILGFSMEIDQPFIAAILTVIGYSINDTVIIFDRVREVIGEHSKRGLVENTNNAINLTLSRTLITSGTTLLVLLVLFIFGGEAIRGFSFAILLGVAVGTYSSVFIASPIMTDLSKKEIEKKA